MLKSIETNVRDLYHMDVKFLKPKYDRHSLAFDKEKIMYKVDIIYANHIGLASFFFFRKKSLIKSSSVHVYINIYKLCRPKYTKRLRQYNRLRCLAVQQIPDDYTDNINPLVQIYIPNSS